MTSGPRIPPYRPKRIILLGSTGSIGTQTLEVISALDTTAGRCPPFVVVGLAANGSVELLDEQARRFGVKAAVSAQRDGGDSVVRLVQEVEADLVVSAIVGAAGLAPTHEAVRLERHVAIANKESLVVAGHLLAGWHTAVGRSVLLPIDSEHSAIWQATGGEKLPTMGLGGRILLTASGGPFRRLSRDEAFHRSPAEALQHPRWKMGRKITVDSATMVNKAFEMIEARWLFGCTSGSIDVLIHPQSIVHSLFEHKDGSIIAQLGTPDMRGPIGVALTANHDGTIVDRYDAGARRLSFKEARTLEFEPACEERWEALALARRVIDESWRHDDSALGAVFNAANEVAVEAFLAGRLPFGRITQVCREVMDRMDGARAGTLEQVLALDAEARSRAAERIGAPAGGAR